MIWNYEQLVIKKETTDWTTVIPTVFVEVEKTSLNTKISKREKEQIEGKLLSPGELVKGKIEITGTVDLFANKFNLPYMLAMVMPLLSTTDNWDGTYTHEFDGQNTYGLNTYTVEQTKDGTTERLNWVRANGFNLTLDEEVVKLSMDLIGKKGCRVAKVLANTSASITINKDFAALFVTWDKIVEAWDAQKVAPSNIATVVSVDYTTWVITVWAWEWTYYTVWKAITLQRIVVAWTSTPTLRWYEWAKVEIDGSEIAVSTFWTNVTNANEARYLTWSNAAKRIRQGQRRNEITFEVDTEETGSINILKKYSAEDTANLKLTLIGDDIIGSWTRKASLELDYTVSFTEAMTDVAVNEFEIVNVTAIATAINTVKITTDIATI